MNNIYYTKIYSPVGYCILASLEDKICWLSLDDEGPKFKSFINDYVDLVNSELLKNNFNKFKKAYPTIARVIVSKNISIIEDKTRFVKVITLLEDYFNGKKVDFKTVDLIYLTGTNFQHKVWDALREIEYGTTKSYKEIAEAVGDANSFRAVGNANGKNMIPLIIPCHRVIKHNGDPGGYSAGPGIKQKLLQIEGIRK